MLRHVFFTGIFCCIVTMSHLGAQTVIRGKVVEFATGDPVIGANVSIPSAGIGTVTNEVGEFELNSDYPFPLVLLISYTGLKEVEIEIHTADQPINITLSPDARLEEVVVQDGLLSEKQKQSQFSHESMSRTEILLNPSADLSTGMGYKKDIDVVSSSLAFKVINTRGFNSTAPVRMLQLIDGVDNQSPGLNFSLGNFLGASELDLLRMDVIVGASSPFYGPNAFNGVIIMETLDPFVHQGLSGMVKVGERNLIEMGLRYADAIKNKNGQDIFAFKFNIYGLKAREWQAENYEPITDSRVDKTNPGGYDAINIYGDEYDGQMDYTKILGHKFSYPGLGSFYRTGYKEVDLVDYGTQNLKSNLSLQFRLNPDKGLESTEVLLSSAIGSGTTVFQGDNRFSLKDILFFQHRLELRKRGNYFLRAYYTHEDAGNSYDPYFTALRLQEACKDNETWANDYVGHWRSTYPDKMKDMGYPMWMPTPPHFNFDEAMDWLVQNQDSLTQWHSETAIYANAKNPRNAPWMRDFLEPGTAEFDSAFQAITGRFNNEDGGTRFYSKSALFHIQGEYIWKTKVIDRITTGGNFRQYSPDSKGTIFHDTVGTRITNSEFGMYAGVKKSFFNDDKLIAEATIRLDKNQNFNWIQTPALSLVYQPIKETFLRVSYSSALRNPTLSDQYLYLNVGPAILAGHIEPVDSVITPASFIMALDSINLDKLVYFTVPALRPERVKTIEFGIRSAIGKKFYADVSYYHSSYKDFLGYVVGLTSDFEKDPIFPAPYNTQVYRYSANSETKVTTEGWGVGLNWFISTQLSLSGNYSFNVLRKTQEDDPIIPAFNTPKHKYNLGFNLNSIQVKQSGWLRNVSMGVQYKWVDGYIFEGSPQFTGEVPSYGQVDAQVNIKIPVINTMIKVGASNLLDNKHIETYGGPKVGRLAYIQARYNF